MRTEWRSAGGWAVALALCGLAFITDAASAPGGPVIVLLLYVLACLVATRVSSTAALATASASSVLALVAPLLATADPGAVVAPTRWAVVALAWATALLTLPLQRKGRQLHRTVRERDRLEEHNRALLRLTGNPDLWAGSAIQVLRTLARTAADELDVDRVGIWLFEDDRTRLRCAILYDRTADAFSSGDVIRRERCPTYFAAAERERQIDASSIRDDPRTAELWEDYARPADIRALLDAPIRLQGEVRGVVCHEQTGAVRDWTDLDRMFAASVGDTAAAALQKRRTEHAEARFRRLFEEVGEGVYFTSVEGDIYEFNPAFEALVGYGRDELLDLDASHLYARPEQRRAFQREILDSGSVDGYELQIRRKDGRLRTCSLTASVVRGAGGEVEGYQGVIRDVTDQKQLERELRHQALHDTLTGLPNRALFRDRLVDAISEARTSSSGGPELIFVDLDGFKRVNDTYGHTAGDEVLRRLAERLSGKVGEEAIVARLGGDEFGVLLAGPDGTAGADGAAERVCEVFASPFELPSGDVHLAASVGVAHTASLPERLDELAEDPEVLVRAADRAMFRAKNLPGTRAAAFDPALDTVEADRLRRENEIRAGLDRGEFANHYQPIVSATDGGVRAVEALARWIHPERGLLPPSEFIPVAEESELILELGQELLGRAAEELYPSPDGGRAGASAGAAPPASDPPRLFFNLSAPQLADPRLEERLAAALDRGAVDPSDVTVEVTETHLMNRPDRIQTLKRLGFQVAVDDFGTGYSSLRYLSDLSIDTLKIDMSFVHGLAEDPSARSIVEAIVTMGRSLGLAVVGEGVETEEQAEILRRLGCDLLQGFHFGRPEPAEGSGWRSADGDRPQPGRLDA